MKKILKYSLAFVLIAGLVSCGGLKSSRQKGFSIFKFRAPYVSKVNYFGYVSKDIKPDGKYKGKDTYYLYFWVPAVIDEVGVCMYSPADMKPAEGDFQHPKYAENIAKDAEAFFDTYLVLERLAIIDNKKIKNGGKVFSLLTTNDDSGELHKNPAGRKYNSLLRHVSQVSNPLKALIRGVYRISFTSFRGSVQGSYIAQVGTNIPGVVIASSLKELHEKVNAPAPAPAE